MSGLKNSTEDVSFCEYYVKKNYKLLPERKDLLLNIAYHISAYVVLSVNLLTINEHWNLT